MTPTWIFNDGGREAAGFKGQAADCVTRAIAIATGIPYLTIYQDLTELQTQAGKSKSKSARTGIDKKITRRYMQSLGWVWHPTMTIGSGTTVHLRADELPPGRIVCQTSRHVVAVIDGVIHDTHDPSRDGTRCVYGYFLPNPDFLPDPPLPTKWD